MSRLYLQLTLLFLTLLCTCVRAQTHEAPVTKAEVAPKDWQPVDLADVRGDRRVEVARAAYARIDAERLRKALFTAPHERDVTAEGSSFRISLPLPDAPATFRIVAYDVSEPAGLARFPNVRTFYGVDERDPERTVFLDWTARGFHASVRGGGRPAVFIDPLFRGQTDLYQVYGPGDYDASQIERAVCQTTVNDGDELPGPAGERPKAIGDCALRQYRFTTTATAEYSNYHGATSAAQANLVHAAVVTTTNRLNQIFTRDISVRFQLVGNNDLLYFYNPSTDPFSGGNATQRDQNTPVVNDIIGVDNYDLGHLVHGSGGGGISFFRGPCNPSNKARCFTSSNTPEGSYFNVDFVAHEIGHSFNGRHTQNNECNRDGNGSVEPGSGSTIMSYAGICSPNVQGVVTDYFHGRSIEQMTTFVELESGGCATIVDRRLDNPVIAPLTDHLIPQGTPFRLDATATGNGALTYNWEQVDREVGAAMPPEGSNASGPLFRSFAATATGERHFPEFDATLAFTDPTWEELPETARDLTFRLTALNTNAAYGCARMADLTVSTLNQAGPFAITSPPGGITVAGGANLPVDWTTGGTELAPLLEDRIDVLFSDDDGQNWTEVLLGTPNSGTATVSLPGGVSTTTARLMLRSRKSVYYAVSRPFTVDGSGPVPPVTLLNPQTLVDCVPPEAYTWTFATNPQNGSTDPISWSVATPLPANVTGSFSVNPVVPGERFDFTLTGLPALGSGDFTIELRATSNAGDFTTTVGVDTRGTRAAPPLLAGPAAGAVTDLRPTLALELAAGTTAEVEISADPDFATIDYTTTVTDNQPFRIGDYLAEDATYYLRAQAFDPANTCGPSPVVTQTFTTRSDCALVATTGNDVLIADYAAPAELSVRLPAVTIADLDVAALELGHTYVGDLTVDLITPAGNTINLISRECGSDDDVDIHFDDEAATDVLACPLNGGGFFRSANDALSLLDGTAAAGLWRLRVTDNAAQDDGRLRAFALRVCGARLLPVTWLAFTASGQKDHIALHWTTTAETDNAGFYVERQAPATDTWRELGFVGAAAGAGERLEEHYDFADRTALPHTDYVYRLRQTDLDGTVSYSPLATARYGTTNVGGLTVFPNPTRGQLTYHLSGATQARPYQLHDARGRLVRTGTLLPAGGTLDVSGLDRGVYLLQTGGDTVRVVRL